MSYPKFNNIDVIWDLTEDCGEWDHVQKVLELLDEHLGALRFAENFVFYITSQTENLKIDDESKAVVYQIRDSIHGIPSYANKVFMVFKNYLPLNPAAGVVHGVPLGCHKSIISLDVQIMQDRTIDLFFMGRSDNREEFFDALEEKIAGNSENWTVMIEKNVEYQHNVYAHNMAQSKIALCPKSISHETFRLYEAMRAGCVVVAARQLQSWFTNDWPVIEIDDWGELKDVASEILNDNQRLQEISEKTRLWWKENCSEEAVALYIARKLSLKLMKSNL